MSLLSKATKGVIEGPLSYIIYGFPGIGKTTFASQWPDHLILDIEDGSKNIPGANRIKAEDLPTFEDLNKYIDELINSKTDIKAVAIDSSTILEKLIEAAVCKEHGVPNVGVIPYGGGPVAVRSKLAEFLTKLSTLKRKMDVIIVGHAHSKQYTDPNLGITYDRYILQNSEKFAQQLEGWTDNMFYCASDVEASIDAKTKKTKATSDGSKVMFTEWRPGAVAKNRKSLPYELPMSYQALKAAMTAAKPMPLAELKASIAALLKTADALTQNQVQAALAVVGDDEKELVRIKAKLLTIRAA